MMLDYVTVAPIPETVTQLVYFQDGELIREEFTDSYHFAQRVKKLRNARQPFNSRIHNR